MKLGGREHNALGKESPEESPRWGLMLLDPSDWLRRVSSTSLVCDDHVALRILVLWSLPSVMLSYRTQMAQRRFLVKGFLNTCF